MKLSIDLGIVVYLLVFLLVFLLVTSRSLFARVRRHRMMPERPITLFT
ncbi:hypothetical protein [Ciceribacter selenitireducens]|nr:hypothetical protein [Ciceribacter selenitireducens]